MTVERIGDATLYLGDCLKILPTLGPVDAVVTDPPWKAGNGTRILRRPGDGFGVAPSRVSTSLRYGSIGKFSSEAIRKMRQIAGDVFVLCGYMELGEVIRELSPVRQIFVWHNTRPTPIPGPIARRNVSFIVWGGDNSKIMGRWESCLFQFPSPQAGCMATERILNSDGTTAHPSQEPLGLFESLIAPLGGSICDPYMGSGTTGVACANFGRRFIGIEIEPKYFDIARKRIRDAYAQPRLPLEEVETVTQGELI